VEVQYLVKLVEIPLLLYEGFFVADLGPDAEMILLPGDEGRSRL